MDAAHKRPLAAFVVVSLASGMLLGQAARDANTSSTSAGLTASSPSGRPSSAGPASGGRVDATVGPTPDGADRVDGADHKSIGRAPVLAPLRGPEITVLIAAPMYDPASPGDEGESPSETPTVSTGEPVEPDEPADPDDGSSQEPSPEPEPSTDTDPTPSEPPKVKPTPTTPPRPTPPRPSGPPDRDEGADGSGARPTLAPTGAKPRP